MSARNTLRDRLFHYDDPETSTDPRIRALLTELRSQQLSPTPRPEFVSETRAMLVAVAPRLVSEGEVEHSRSRKRVPFGAADASGITVRPPRIVHRRLLGLLVTAAMLVLVLGGVNQLSRNALPGDTMYALKRAGENVELSLTSGDIDRGRAHLERAGTRLDEVQKLLTRVTAMALAPGHNAEGQISSHTADLVRQTLDDADSDVKDGSTLLTDQAAQSHSSDALDVLSGHAQPDLAKTQQIVNRIPAGDLHDRAQASADLLSRVLARSDALRAVLPCSCLESAQTDDIGTIPCNSPCSIVPAKTQNSRGVPVKPAATTHRPTPTQSAGVNVSVPGSAQGTLPVPQPTISVPNLLQTSSGAGLLPAPSLPSLPIPSLPLTGSLLGGSPLCLPTSLGPLALPTLCVQLLK